MENDIINDKTNDKNFNHEMHLINDLEKIQNDYNDRQVRIKRLKSIIFHPLYNPLECFLE